MQAFFSYARIDWNAPADRKNSRSNMTGLAPQVHAAMAERQFKLWRDGDPDGLLSLYPNEPEPCLKLPCKIDGCLYPYFSYFTANGHTAPLIAVRLELWISVSLLGRGVGRRHVTDVGSDANLEALLMHADAICKVSKGANPRSEQPVDKLQ